MDPARIDAALASLARLAEVTRAESTTIALIADRYRETLSAGGTLFFAGNGGSAADAQHLATEYVVRYTRHRAPMRALALTTDTSLLTAVGNDLGFEEIFARQVTALARPGDLLILHSTSGESPNLLAATRAAHACGAKVIAFLGRGGGALRTAADMAVVVAADDSSRIQEMHLAIQHAIVNALEDELMAGDGA